MTAEGIFRAESPRYFSVGQRPTQYSVLNEVMESETIQKNGDIKIISVIAMIVLFMVIVMVSFGKEYYIRCGLEFGVVVGRPYLELVDEETGESEIASIQGTASQSNRQQTTNETNKTQTTANTSKKVFRFGLRTGINFTNMSGYDDISKMLFGFQSGIVTDFSLAKSFSIQAGLLIAQQGFRTTAVYRGQKSPYKITLSDFTICILPISATSREIMD